MRERILTDIRQAILQLRRKPATLMVAIAVLAMGIGINTTVFTIASSVLLRDPAGVHQPEHLVRVYRSETNGVHGPLSYFELEHIRSGNAVFENVAGYDLDGFPVVLRAGREPEPGVVSFVSGNFFGTLGVPAAAGRLLAANDDTQAAPPVAVLSHALWRRAFGQRPDVIGQAITVNGRSFTIVGVAPAAFRALGVDDVAPDLWLPFWSRHPVLGRRISDLVRSEGSLHTFVVGVARLRPGRTIADATANLNLLGQQFAQSFPDDGLRGFSVTPHVELDPDRRAALITMLQLLGVVSALVLVIVCANLANLLLVRATTRLREMGVRLSLGATRGDLVRQLMTESLVLAFAGAGAGLLLATWSADVLKQRLPVEVMAAAKPDLRVFLFATGIAVVCALAFGLYPALRAARTSAGDVLRGGARVAEGKSRARSTLVAAQIAISLIVTVSAGLFVRTLQEVGSLPLGYDLDQRLRVALNLRPHGYTAERAAIFYQQLQERVAGLTGVEKVALMSDAPLSGGGSSSTMEVEGIPLVNGRGAQLNELLVGPGLFAALGMTVKQGRDFMTADRNDIVVNEALANRYWPGKNPIGRRIRDGSDTPWQTVIGVVNDTRHYRVLPEPVPIVFKAFHQDPSTRGELIVVANGSPEALIPSIRRAVLELDPNVAPRDVVTLRETYERVTRQFTTNASLVGLLGLLAVTLSAIGLYGTLSFAVAQRTREIGVRMAVGARAAEVWSLIMRDGLTMAAFGLVTGTLGAFAATRLIAQSLYGITPLDPTAFLVAVVALASVVTLASWLPARRASRVEPLVALRDD